MRTSSPDSIDADAVLAVKAVIALEPGETITIATSNPAHLNRLARLGAQTWDHIRWVDTNE
jgi:hypothetical protein